MKILVVDDEPRHLRGMVNLIRQLRPDAQVTSTKDGASALELVRADRPEAVLTDIRMPNMDGLTFLQRLKEEGIKTKVVMVSAYNLFEYAQTAVRHGAYDYLLKPVEVEMIEDILSRIELQLVSESMQQVVAEDLKHPIKLDKYEVIITNCLSWIQENTKEDVTLERAAEHFFFNPSYFSTLIKSRTGRTFSEHVTEARMRRAKELLSDNKLRIYEISVECGYQDTKYFCRVFKKHYGMSPEAYKHTSLPERKREE